MGYQIRNFLFVLYTYIVHLGESELVVPCVLSEYHILDVIDDDNFDDSTTASSLSST